MAVVIDASLCVRLVSNGEWADRIETLIDRWLGEGEDLHAPELAAYEIESTPRRFVFRGELTEAQAIDGLRQVAALGLVLHRHPGEGRILRMAGRQRTRVAYDAAYLVLAEDLAAPLWTADRGMAATGRSVGIETHFIGD